MRIGVQMDPIEAVNIAGDTTFALMEAAQARGHELQVFEPRDLFYRENEVYARARRVRVARVEGAHAQISAPQVIALREAFDVILMRQDPPFDMAYLTAAHLLELVHPDVLVVNDPGFVRSSPEKIFPLLFSDLMTPTLIGRDMGAIEDFRATHKDLVIKPLFGAAGGGVFRVGPQDGNFRVILETMLGLSREPIMVQAFIPSVSEGDKRIILVDGEIAGGFNRVPPRGEIRSNLAAGGIAAAVELSAADRAICARLGPELRRRGLLFVGIDVIAGFLSEINVTSPTGARALLAFTGIDACQIAWEAIEQRWRETRK